MGLLTVNIHFAAQKTNLFLGPCTKASPDGFQFSEATMKILSEGRDLAAMVKAMVSEFKRLREELLETEGIWAIDEDYGSYAESVRLSYPTHSNQFRRYVYLILRPPYYCVHCYCHHDSYLPLMVLNYMQPELHEGIQDGRFPAYLACVKDLSDEVLDRIVPNPEQVENLVSFLSQRFKWADEFRRLCLPRPPHKAPRPYTKGKAGSKARSRKRSRSSGGKSEASLDIPVDEMNDPPSQPAPNGFLKDLDEAAKAMCPTDTEPTSPTCQYTVGSLNEKDQYAGIEYMLMAKTQGDVEPRNGTVPAPCLPLLV